MWIIVLIIAVFIVYAVSSDIDGSIQLLKDSVKKTLKLIWETEESETQKKIKELFKKLSIRILNIFFLLVVFLAMWWGLKSLYDEYNLVIPNYIESIGGIWKNFYIIFVIALSVVVVFFVLINALLWLFKLVKITDIYKIYLFIEIITMLLNSPSTNNENQKILLIQLFNKVFEKEIIKQPKISSETNKTNTFNYLITPSNLQNVDENANYK